jgi:hypothetical protein
MSTTNTATVTPEPRVFRCIPFNAAWVGAHDVRAIYRRPRRTVGEYDEVINERGPDGLPLFDIIGPLPMRRHADWARKGYEYVTVYATPDPTDMVWPLVVAWLRANQLNPADYLQHPYLGTWNPKLYLATADGADRARFDALRAMVERLGSEAVIAVRQMTDPNFTLPPALRDIPAPAPRGSDEQ